jgi:site-specific recombinase XerC
MLLRQYGYGDAKVIDAGHQELLGHRHITTTQIYDKRRAFND